MPSSQLSPLSPAVPAHCSIVPPYLLEALATSGDPDLEAHAHATMAVDRDLRRDRRTAELRPTTTRKTTRRPARGTAEGPQRSIHDAE